MKQNTKKIDIPLSLKTMELCYTLPTKTIYLQRIKTKIFKFSLNKKLVFETFFLYLVKEARAKIFIKNSNPKINDGTENTKM